MRPALKLTFITIAALFVLAVAAAFVFRRDITIAFHRREMLEAFAAASSKAPGRQSDYIVSFEYHRDRLAALGYFEQRVFPLQRVQPRTPEWKALFRALNAVHTNIADGWFAMRGYEATSPTQVLVWTRPQFIATYEQIITERDR